MMTDARMTGYHYSDDEGNDLSDGGPFINILNNIACLTLPERGHGVRGVR